MKCEEYIAGYCGEVVRYRKYVEIRRCDKCCLDCIKKCDELCDKARGNIGARFSNADESIAR